MQALSLAFFPAPAVARNVCLESIVEAQSAAKRLNDAAFAFEVCIDRNAGPDTCRRERLWWKQAQSELTSSVAALDVWCRPR